MSKIFLCLMVLIGLYNCETYKEAKVYDIPFNSDSKKEVELNIPEGEDFALKFEGNPTTGYNWFLLNVEEVDGSIKATNFEYNGIGEYVSDPKYEMMDGGSGFYYYTFKAIKASNEVKTLNFCYRRFFEKKNNPGVDVVVKITVS